MSGYDGHRHGLPAKSENNPRGDARAVAASRAEARRGAGGRGRPTSLGGRRGRVIGKSSDHPLAVLMAVLLVIGIGVVAGRRWLAADDTTDVPTAAVGAPAAGLTPSLAITGRPVSPPAQPGPSRGPAPDGAAGVGQVDRRTRTGTGAVAAGVQYATLLARTWPLAAGDARAVTGDAAADGYRDRLVAGSDQQLRRLHAQADALGGTTSYRQAVLATRLVDLRTSDTIASADPQPGRRPVRAQVSVWFTLIVTHTSASQGSSPPSSGSETSLADGGVDGRENATGVFLTSDIYLTWERGAWRLSGSRDRSGPTPLVDGSPSTSEQLVERLEGFQDWRP